MDFRGHLAGQRFGHQECREDHDRSGRSTAEPRVKNDQDRSRWAGSFNRSADCEHNQKPNRGKKSFRRIQWRALRRRLYHHRLCQESKRPRQRRSRHHRDYGQPRPTFLAFWRVGAECCDDHRRDRGSCQDRQTPKGSNRSPNRSSRVRSSFAGDGSCWLWKVGVSPDPANGLRR